MCEDWSAVQAIAAAKSQHNAPPKRERTPPNLSQQCCMIYTKGCSKYHFVCTMRHGSVARVIRGYSLKKVALSRCNWFVTKRLKRVCVCSTGCVKETAHPKAPEALCECVCLGKVTLLTCQGKTELFLQSLPSENSDLPWQVTPYRSLR